MLLSIKYRKAGFFGSYILSYVSIYIYKKVSSFKSVLVSACVPFSFLHACLASLANTWLILTPNKRNLCYISKCTLSWLTFEWWIFNNIHTHNFFGWSQSRRYGTGYRRAWISWKPDLSHNKLFSSQDKEANSVSWVEIGVANNADY